MSRLRIVTLAGDPEREAQVAETLSPLEDVSIELRCVERSELLAALKAGGIDAIVSVGAPSWFDRHVALEAQRAGITTVGIVDNALEGEQLGALGAHLVPYEASPQEIVDRCHMPVAEARLSGDTRARTNVHDATEGRLVAVWGPKGAPGRSTVAINLACELARSDMATVIVDCDQYGGDILQLLGVEEDVPGLVWAERLAARGELNHTVMQAELRRAYSGGPVVLGGITRADLWPGVSSAGLADVLQALRSTFRFVVADTGFCIEKDWSSYPGAEDGRNRMARTVLRAADVVVAVCRGDAVGIKHFLAAYQSLEDLVPADRIAVCCNRVLPADAAEIADVLQSFVGKRPAAMVPESPREMRAAFDRGSPVRAVTPRSRTTDELSLLCGVVGGRAGNRGFLTRLREVAR